MEEGLLIYANPIFTVEIGPTTTVCIHGILLSLIMLRLHETSYVETSGNLDKLRGYSGQLAI